jgi:hypothetical protein
MIWEDEKFETFWASLTDEERDEVPILDLVVLAWEDGYSTGYSY